MLTPCSSCGRHVRASELACPFCASSVPEVRARAVRPRVRGLGRAAILAVSTSFAAACGGGAAPAEPAPEASDTAGGDAADPGQTDPGQSDPGQTDPGQTDPGQGDPGAGSDNPDADVVAMYGAPSPVEHWV
ncbi:MAG: hypothetical protein K8H88_07675 [Sandaracinaceae bacterium]|nr:hypothetical protein [Sandaracinaceae bacterium]